MDDLEGQVSELLTAKLDGVSPDPSLTDRTLARSARRRRRNAMLMGAAVLVVLVGGSTMASLALDREPTENHLPAAGEDCGPPAATRYDFVVYLRQGMTDEQKAVIEERLSEDRSVAVVVYLSSAEAVEEYREKFKGRGRYLMLVPERGFPDQFRVEMVDPASRGRLMSELRDHASVDLVVAWSKFVGCDVD